MRDPFESLREPARPTAPDPLFAAQLRARLARALTLPKGVTVSNLSADHSPTPGAAAAAPAHPSDIVYVSLWVPDASQAAAFFADVLGWRYRPDSEGQRFQVHGQSLPHGIFGGQARSTLFLCFGVDDVPEAARRVRAAGGNAGEPTVAPFGVTSDCVDDQGVPFAVVETARSEHGSERPPANGSRPGDVSYLTVEVRDSAKARAFYGSVLGWRFSPGRVEDGFGVEEVVPMTGMHGGMSEAVTVPMYRVDDIAAAVERVRVRGGHSTDPEAQPYGLTADCRDDQGTHFYLGQH